MRIFERGDKPATATGSTSVLGDSLFDRLLRQQLSRKSNLRNPLTGDPFDPCERYNPHEVKLRQRRLGNLPPCWPMMAGLRKPAPNSCHRPVSGSAGPSCRASFSPAGQRFVNAEDFLRLASDVAELRPI